jgi:hypothetical protein
VVSIGASAAVGAALAALLLTALPALAAVPSPVGLPLSVAAGEAGPSPFAGYSENLLGPLTLTSTITVPTVKCSQQSTWGTEVSLVAVMENQTTDATVEDGGGVSVGCTLTGSPAYAPVLCDPSLSGPSSSSAGCESLDDTVFPGDIVQVTAAASGGCNETCSDVSATVKDVTEQWSESATGASGSDFAAFVGASGGPPLARFGRITMSAVAVDGSRFSGVRTDIVGFTGHTLARTGRLAKGGAFTVKWVQGS